MNDNKGKRPTGAAGCAVLLFALVILAALIVTYVLMSQHHCQLNSLAC